jgi:hypothetical protein
VQKIFFMFTKNVLSLYSQTKINQPWKVYFDDAVNKHGKGVGAVLESLYASI